MKDLSLLVGRILLVAIFPVSAYYKIIGWPGIVGTVEKAGLPYAMRAAGIPAPSSSTEHSGALLVALSRLRRCRESVDCAAAQLIIPARTGTTPR